MKTSLIVITLLAMTSFSAQAKKIDREGTLDKVSKGSGTNIGGGNNGSEYLATWCRGQSSLLRNFRDRARMKLENTGDYNAANKILNDGMVQALSNAGSGASESFLHKSLIRGLTISKHLGATLGGNSERKAMAANHILNNYYEFIIETVGKNLDLNGQIPYLASTSNEEMNEKAARFEENFVTYASSQLDWILSNLINEVRLGNKIQVVPVGDARSILKVALTLSGATAIDLEDSLWSYRFSCAISDLKILNETLTTYDQGNKEMFEDEKQALTYVNSELKRISKTLRLKESCL